MSQRVFIIVVVGLLLALWLATTPVGAMFGFFVGIAIAFFVAPILMLSGLPGEAWAPALWVLGGLYASWVLYQAVRGVVDWRRGPDKPEPKPDAKGFVVRGYRPSGHDAARSRWALALTLAALVPIVLWSSEALQRAWP